MITLQRQIDDNSCLLACIGMLAGVDHREWLDGLPGHDNVSGKLDYLESVASKHLPWLVPYFRLIRLQEISYGIWDIPDTRRGIFFTWDNRKATESFYAKQVHCAVFADGMVYDPETTMSDVSLYRTNIGLDTPWQATVTLTITDPHS